MLDSLIVVLTGFVTGLSLIVAIGAQNAFVLRQGLLRQHELPIALLCAVSDALLIVAGVAGIGAVVQTLPWLLQVLRWGGVAFLLWTAFGALKRARGVQSLELAGERAPSLRAALVTAAAFTFLNPHVYIDTMLFVGSIANSHHDQRWWFALGAGSASVVWFFGLAMAARRLAPLFAKPATWRWLDLSVAVVMIVVALSLALKPLSV